MKESRLFCDSILRFRVFFRRAHRFSAKVISCNWMIDVPVFLLGVMQLPLLEPRGHLEFFATGPPSLTIVFLQASTWISVRHPSLHSAGESTQFWFYNFIFFFFLSFDPPLVLNDSTAEVRPTLLPYNSSEISYSKVPSTLRGIDHTGHVHDLWEFCRPPRLHFSSKVEAVLFLKHIQKSCSTFTMYSVTWKSFTLY